MLMTNENVRVYPHDRFLGSVVIRFLPLWILPNHLTLLRFGLVPFVLWYIAREDWGIGFFLFLFAAFTDALDGSMARLRKQITLWGTLADPAADKLLIGSVAVLFVAKKVDPIFALSIVILELLIIVSGAIRHRRKGMVSANWLGKIKMLLQVTGVALLLIATWSGTVFLVPISIVVFGAAIFFGVLSLITYSL